MQSKIRAAAVAVVGILAVTPATQASSWNGSTGNWGVASNWVAPADVPDTMAESANIGAGTVTMTADYAIGALAITGGTLTGATHLNANSFFWYGGLMSGSNTTDVTTTATFQTNSVLYLTGRTLAIDSASGTSTLSGGTSTYGMNLSGGAQLLSYGTLNITDDSSIVGNASQMSVNILGSLVKTGGSATSTVYSVAGSVAAIASKSGTLDVYLRDGASSFNVNFGATAGATLRLDGSGTQSFNKASFGGAGTIDLHSGTISAGIVSGQTITGTAADLRLTGATLIGTYDLSNLNWTAGQIGDGTNATTVSIATSGAITPPSAGTTQYVQLKKATLNLSGDTTIGGNAQLGLIPDDNSHINNSGTLRFTGGAGIYGTQDGSGSVVNTGTIVKTGAGTVSEVYSLSNSGAIQVQSGQLHVQLAGTSTNAGTYTPSTGGILEFSAVVDPSGFTFGPATVFNGSGTYRMFYNVMNIGGTVSANNMTFYVRDIVGPNLSDTFITSNIGNMSTGAPGGFTKTGDGQLALSGANTYTGATTLNQGSLLTTTPASANILSNSGGITFTGVKTSWVLNYTGGAVPVDPVNTIKSILTSGAASNFATGKIRSTVTGPDLTFGYSDSGSAVTVALVIPGDANLDGKVDFNDFLVLQNNFNVSNTRWDQGNFNYDGATNFNDFLVLQNHFGQSIAGVPVAFTSAEVAAMNAFAAADAVPEPTSTVLAATTAIVITRRRRYRQDKHLQ